MVGDLAGALAVGLGARRRGGAEAVDHAVVHAEGGRDQHGELGVRVARAGRERALDVAARDGARVAPDAARDLDERGELGREALRAAGLDAVDEVGDAGGAVAAQQLRRERAVRVHAVEAVVAGRHRGRDQLALGARDRRAGEVLDEQRVGEPAQVRLERRA